MAADVTLDRGDSHTLRIPVFTPSGAAITLSGASARWWLARSSSTPAASAWVKKSTGAGITWTTETATNEDGEEVEDVFVLNIAIIPTDTESLPAGTWHHEAEVIDGSGNVRTVRRGPFKLNRTLIIPA